MCSSSETVQYKKISLEPYKHPNVITAWLDMSFVYGSSQAELKSLRGAKGKLKLSMSTTFKKGLLPFGKTCTRSRHLGGPLKEMRCFIAGDARVSENVGLTTLHTVFHRHHNHIVDQLHLTHPSWSDDQLFYKARDINIAMYQKIIVDEFLPKLTGKPTNEILGKYPGYNPTVDSQMSIEFTTAASRYGHAQISGETVRFGKDYSQHPLGNFSMFEGFHASDKIYNEGGIDPFIRGMLVPPARPAQDALSNGFHKMVREFLFAFNQHIPVDLVAINIQRGRDHALQPWLQYRRLFGLSVPQNWDQLAADPDFKHLSKEWINGLRKVLKDVHEIDLYVGGFLEKPQHGIVGPTFQAIMNEQFQRSRVGDRFWFEKEDRFTGTQLKEINKTSLSLILCLNSDGIKKVPKKAFNCDPLYKFVDCSSFEDLDYTAWKPTS